MKTEITLSKLAPRNEENSEGQTTPANCENHFQTLIENAPDGIALINANGEFKFVSASGRRMFGYSAEEPINIEPASKTHPDDLGFVLSHLMQVISDPTYTPTIQYRFATKDEQWIWIETAFRNLLHDPNVSAIVMNYKNITEEKKAKETLQKSEERFSRLLQHLDTGIVVHGPDTRIITSNPRAAVLLGLSNEQMIGKIAIDSAWKFVTKDNTVMCLDNYPVNKIIATKQPIRNQISGVQQSVNSETVWLNVNGFPVLNKDGEIVEVVTSFNDITEQKKAEDNLKEKEVQYRNMTNSGPALIWTSGTDKLCYYFNNTWLEFTGRTLEQEIGNGWTEGVHPDDFDQCLETYIHAFDKQELFEMEYRLKHATGEYRWILDIGTPNYDSTENFIGYIGNCFDITERKKFENELQLSERKFRNIFENSVIGKSLTTIDGKLSVNRSLSEIVGYSQEELSQMNWVDITHPDDVEYNRMINALILKGEKSFANWEKRYIHKDGHIVWVNITTLLLRDDDEKPVHFITEIYDISARKKAENALRESELFFRQSQEAARIGSYNLNIATGFWSSSEVLDNIFGIDKNYIKSIQGWSELVAEVDREMMNDYFSNHVLAQKQGFNKEYRILRKSDGEVRWVLGLGELILKNNEIVSMVGTIQDITERKIVEKKLAESELFFRKSQEAGKIGSYYFNVENGLWNSSEVMDNIFGFDKHFIKGLQGWTELIAEEDKDLLTNYFTTFVAERKKRFNLEFRISRKVNGKAIWVNCLGELVIENGVTVGVAGTIQDITERKDAEAKIQETMNNLQRFHNLTVGRELSMIALKKEINELLIGIGMEPKYVIVE